MRPTPRTFMTRMAALAAVLAIIAGCSSPEQRAQSHYERGSEFAEAGDSTRAMLEFRNAVKLDETHVPAWYAIATIQEQNQNWPALDRSLKRVMELDASHAAARAKSARLHLAAGDVEKALELVNAANALKADDSEIHALRAAVLLRLGDRDGAKQDAERALYLDRDNADAYGVLAADAMRDENSTAALRLVDRGLQADPRNSGLLLFKLGIHEAESDLAKIETTLRQLIFANADSQADSRTTRRALVSFLLDQDRTEDADTELRALVVANPTDVSSGLELVQFTQVWKGPDAARQELLRLIAAHPETIDYQLAMARLELLQSRREAAIEVLDAIIARGEPSSDVQRARLLLAEIELQADDTETAASLVAEVLAADEKNVDALAMRANLHLQSGDYDNATRDVREALNQQPQSVPLLQLLGKVFERQGVINLANDQYIQAVRVSNYTPSVAVEYANFLLGRGDLARAEAILSESLSRFPYNTDVLTSLGRVRLSQQDWVGAQEVAELLQKSGDRSGISDQVLGVALLGQQKFDQSIDTLKVAYSAAPHAVRPMYSLFTAYLSAGNVDEAEALLDAVLTANPDNADAHVLRGTLHTLKDERDQATAAYTTAIERQPQNPVGYRALATHLVARGKLEDAQAVVRNGREQVPGDFGLDLFMADLLEREADMDGALAVYEGLLTDRPDSLILINNVASLLSDYRTDEASLERAYQLALRLRDVDVPQFKDTLGWIHYRRGEYNAAVGLLEAAVEGLPEHPTVRYHLAMTYAALERHEDAKAEFKKAAELAGEGDPLGERIQAALNDLGKPQPVN